MRAVRAAAAICGAARRQVRITASHTDAPTLISDWQVRYGGYKVKCSLHSASAWAQVDEPACVDIAIKGKNCLLDDNGPSVLLGGVGGNGIAAGDTLRALHVGNKVISFIYK